MTAKKANTEKQDSEGGNVDQIREILFGGHLRAFDERFELVESRLAKETEALRKATDKKIDGLTRLAAEIREEASDRLDGETNSRDLALNKLELAMAQSRADAENQLAAMEDRFTGQISEVRSELKAMHTELAAALAKNDSQQEKVAAKLDQGKVARMDLADLFRGLAETLQPEATGHGK